MHITTIPLTLFFFTDQVNYLSQRGVSFEAASSPGEDLERFSQACHIPCHAVPMARRLAPAADLLALTRLVRLLRNRRPDIVHSHTPKAGLLGTLAACLAGIPRRVLSIFGLPQMTRQGPLKAALDATTRVSCRLARLVWCDSPSMRRQVIERGLCPADKVVVLGKGSVNGIDATGRFDPDRYGLSLRLHLRAGYGIPADALVIGFVGRIVADKGMGELAQAWRTIRQELPAAHLLMVGVFEPDDPLRLEDERLFRTDPRVHLTGWRQDVPEHLAIMDLLVNPSYREGFGVSHLEAAAMALPVLATRIPGSIDSVEDGVTGLLVPPRDATSLALATRRYLSDATLRVAHGKAGRKRVLTSFHPPHLSEALLAHYRGLRTSRSNGGEAAPPRRSSSRASLPRIRP